MRSVIFLGGFALLALAFSLASGNAGEGKKTLKALQKWSGTMTDNELLKYAPKAGYLTNQKALDELWTAWKLADKAPTFDFTKQIVFVQLAPGGPNVPGTNYTLDDKGNLTAVSFSTLIGGPGFGYSIDMMFREGIKSYQGKKIE